MANLSLRNICKLYPGEVWAVKDFNLEVEDKEFLVLVGPSGCGKSTTLRMIAGLEEISSGELYIGDKYVNDVEPKDRNIAMVFQNYALYPHMSVFDNMSFSLKLKKTPKTEIDRRVREAARILEIEELLDRKPKALSGGQRQRVALGRAIVREPAVFLMDEPMSNLDTKLRVQMRTEISKLHKKLGTTFIYVTHDQTEAMTMGSRIVVMKDGVIQQVGEPGHIYNHPHNTFVAGFIGSPQINLMEAQIFEEMGSMFLRFNNATLPVTGDKARIIRNNKHSCREVIIGIRAEDIHEAWDSEGQDSGCFVDAKVEVTEHMGSEMYLYLNICGNDMTAKVRADSKARCGQWIKACFNMEKVHIFHKESGINIL